MKALSIITFLLCANICIAQDHASSSPYQGHSASVAGTLSLPVLLSLDVSGGTQPFRLNSLEDFKTGAFFDNYFYVNVHANVPWTLTVNTPDQYLSPGSPGASANMPVNVLAVKKHLGSYFVPLSPYPQTILQSENTGVDNGYSFDLRYKPNFGFREGSYTANLLFTLSPQ